MVNTSVYVAPNQAKINTSIRSVFFIYFMHQLKKRKFSEILKKEGIRRGTPSTTFFVYKAKVSLSKYFARFYFLDCNHLNYIYRAILRWNILL